MRTLARARPNKRYKWYLSIASIYLEARLTNNTVVFYEIDTKPANGTLPKEKRISEENVRNMFRTDKPLKKQPFLVRENRDCYAVLNRHLVRYKERYKQIRTSYRQIKISKQS